MALPIALALLAAAALSPIQAQPVPTPIDDRQFEITPHAGFQFGGSYEFFDRDFGYTKIDVENSETYGLTFDIPVSRHFQIELMVARQDTELEIAEGIGELVIDDAELTFYHAGVLWQGARGQVRPFGVITVGATRIDPGLTRFDAEYQPSVSIGGGVKIFFSEHVGLRFDGRLMATDLDDDFSDFPDRDDHDCCRYDEDTEDIVQGRATVGLIFAF